MKGSGLNNKTPDELVTLISELRSKLFNLNFQSPDQKVTDTSQAGKIKKDIARALTALRAQTQKK